MKNYVSAHPLMRFDPGFGTERPYPSEATQYRAYSGRVAWLFNPWTGIRRHPADIGSDPFGELCSTGGEIIRPSTDQCAGGSLGTQQGQQP